MPSDHAAHALSSYDFELPEELIAQTPAEVRDQSRLALVGKGRGFVSEARVADLAGLLPEGALLVLNDTMVVPARLFGKKPTGGAVEVLLLTPLALAVFQPDPERPEVLKSRFKALTRASKGPRAGETVDFGPRLSARILSRGEFGQSEVELSFHGDPRRILEDVGRMPLPPYIRREADATDASRYQTVYADEDKPGSAAAPTAGLHFSPELLARLGARGIETARVTLHVGPGTFRPVHAEDIRGHAMHAEWIDVPEATCTAVARAKAEGRQVLAVGTTSARALETAGRGGALAPFCGETDIYIRPGIPFTVIDGLFTNFHLPRSSLLIMVCALAGREAVLSAYREAIERKFRFFSYGDAMLVMDPRFFSVK